MDLRDVRRRYQLTRVHETRLIHMSIKIGGCLKKTCHDFFTT